MKSVAVSMKNDKIIDELCNMDINSMFPQAEDYVDAKNAALYKKVSDVYSITVLKHELPEYRITVLKDSAIITVSETEKCNDSFTHELLHADMKIRELIISDLLYKIWEQESSFNVIWPIRLFGHIGNNMEHSKMLNLYLGMGCDRKKFLLDYSETKCLEGEIAAVEILIRSAEWKAAAELFIAKYFAIKGCPNPAFNYEGFLQRLLKCNKELYSCCDNLWKSWSALEMDSLTKLEQQHNMVELFRRDLKNWILKR